MASIRKRSKARPRSIPEGSPPHRASGPRAAAGACFLALLGLASPTVATPGASLASGGTAGKRAAASGARQESYRRRPEGTVSRPPSFPAGTNAPAPAARAGVTATIVEQGFEGPFPLPPWELYIPAGKASTGWGTTGFRASAGAKSAWCAAGGAAPASAGGPYVGNMEAWIIYGPFSLADATAAQAHFAYWLESEQDGDFLGWYLSTNGSDFFGIRTSGGGSAWFEHSLDFTEIKKTTTIGSPAVWFALIFESNSSDEREGAYVDEISIVKETSTACAYTISPVSVAFPAAGGSETVAVTAAPGCPWTATSSSAWVSITAGGSGTGNGTVGYAVAANTTGVERSGGLTVAGQVLTVRQAAAVFPNSYWLPVASHAAGLGGSLWRTDVGLLNRSVTATIVEVRLVTRGGVITKAVPLAASAQEILVDIVGQLSWSGSAAMEVRSEQPLVVTSRTYNQSVAGTFGQDYDSVATEQGLAAGETGWLGQLTENTLFRTNVAVTNTGAVPASLLVELLDGNGAVLSSYPVSLAPGEWRQENRPFAARAGRADLAKAYARVTVTAGAGIIGYASVVDNRTGDPTTIRLLR